MHGRSTLESKRANEHNALSFLTIQDKQPDRLYFLKSMYRHTREFCHSVWLTFSFDHVDFDFEQVVWPLLSSAAALAIGEIVSTQLSETLTDTKENAFLFKLAIGAGIMLYSAAHSLSETQIETSPKKQIAFAAEALSILYTYYSTFRATHQLLNERIAPEYTTISSIGISAFVVPGVISLSAQKWHELASRYALSQGSQRSDTALVPAGLTSLLNTWLTVNRLLIPEILRISRLFQIGLISDNILNARKILQQFRNLPAFVIDVLPQLIKKTLAQVTQIENSFDFNTQQQKILRVKKDIWTVMTVNRSDLRTGDLLSCKTNFNPDCAPVSGEAVFLDEKKQFVEKSFSINNKAHNGEDKWLKMQTLVTGSTHYKKIDLHTMSEGMQPGVLPGSKLRGAEDAYIFIKPAKEHTRISNHEKKSEINQIIIEHKQRYVFYSGLLSLASAALLYAYRDYTAIPAEAIRLLLRVFQVLVPFSESILRDTYNNDLLAEINQHLPDKPLDIIDAQCLVDLHNVRLGYYKDRFPKNMVILSDKTGTLTTSKMQGRGIWMKDMDEKEEARLLHPRDEKSPVLPTRSREQCLEPFICTSTDTDTPEEFAMRQLLDTPDVKIEQQAVNNHFRKTYRLDEKPKTIDTFDLGICRNAGGRLTLVNDNNHYHLVFCGIPDKDYFREAPLHHAYYSMPNRKSEGSLSRDWCIARTRTPMTSEQFQALHALFTSQKKETEKTVAIESYLSTQTDIIQNLTHQGTFIIDNPVKKDADKFIERYSAASIPVFVLTGDTEDAAKHIANVLCPNYTRKITVLRANEIDLNAPIDTTDHSTIIFVRMNDKVLTVFRRLMSLPAEERPSMIFAKMLRADKGKMAEILRKEGYCVVANGDDTNDIDMMKNANIVIAHPGDDGSFAPGVEKLTTISSTQVEKLLGSEKTFYELFDVYKTDSQFLRIFTRMANSQEKACIAAILKAIKGSMDLLLGFGVPGVREPSYQYWAGPLMDPIFIGAGYLIIKNTADLPLDKQHIGVSRLPLLWIMETLSYSAAIAGATYLATRESTHVLGMAIMTGLYLFQLQSISSGFGHVRDELHPAKKPEALEQPQNVIQARRRFGLFDKCLRRQKNIAAPQTEQRLLLKKTS